MDSDLIQMFRDMSPEDLMIIWTWGGFQGEPPTDPDRAALHMLRGVSKSARRQLARAFVRVFAALPPRSRAALLALLRSRAVRPVRIPAPAPAPVRMTSQRQRSTVAPSRGSPWRAGVGEAPT